MSTIENARRGRDLSSILRQARTLHQIRRIQLTLSLLDAREASEVGMKTAILRLAQYENDELCEEHKTLTRLERENR